MKNLEISACILTIKFFFRIELHKFSIEWFVDPIFISTTLAQFQLPKVFSLEIHGKTYYD